jgi:hypothetical protein
MGRIRCHCYRSPNRIKGHIPCLALFKDDYSEEERHTHARSPGNSMMPFMARRGTEETCLVDGGGLVQERSPLHFSLDHLGNRREPCLTQGEGRPLSK